VPDFFEGRPADISWYPPDNKDKEAKLGKFFEEQGAPGKTVPRVPKIVGELGKSYGVEKWAVLGFCWGGKVRLMSHPGYQQLKY
jgi:dienelactone hydrolase